MTRDLSRLTDEELLALAGPQQTAVPAQDLSTISDEELLAMSGQQPARDPSFFERLGRFGIPERGTGILPSREALAPIGEAALEIGPGLGELAVGAVQRGAEVIGQEGFSRRLGEQQVREREGLTTAQKAGRVAGQIIGTAPIAAGGALLPGVVKGAAAISALTPTEEGTAEAAVKQIGVGVVAGAATLGAIKGGGKLVDFVRKQGQEAIKRVKSGTGARTIQQLEDASVALKTKSQDLYAKLRGLNSDINPKAGAKLVTQLDKALTDSGKLNQKLHGDTMSVVKDIRADAKAGKIGLEGLDQHRQNLSAVILKDTDSISGAVGADGQKSAVLIDKLDDLIEGLSPSDLGVGKKGLRVFRGEFDRRSIPTEKGVLSTSKSKEAARNFSEGGEIKEFTINPNARVIDISDLRKQILGVKILPNPNTLTRDQFDSITGASLVKKARELGFDVIDQSKAGIKSKGIRAANKLLDEEELKIINPNILSESKPSQALEARKLLTEARKDWRVHKKFQRIANLAEKADGDPNRIKAVFQQFVSKKKNLRGFTAAEVKSLKFAAQNTGGEKLLKSLGKFGFDFGSSATAGNTALPALSLAVGGVAGGPLGGVPLVAAGTIARKVQKLTASGKIEDALILIQQGGVDVAEVITKIPSKKVQQELLTRLLSVGAAQQSIQ